MSRKVRTFLAIGFVATTAALVAAQNKAANVTTTICDNNGSTACGNNGSTALLMRSDDYNGGDFATYTTTTKGNSSVSSQIDTSGDWALYWGSPRSLSLTMDPLVGSQPTGPIPIPLSGYYGGQAHSLCPLAFSNLGMGPTYYCQLGVEFHFGSFVYKLAMGPKLPWVGPATGASGVVCNKVESSKCVDWTITSGPDESGQNANVANLYYYDGTNWIFLGQYYNSFQIHVTNP